MLTDWKLYSGSTSWTDIEDYGAALANLVKDAVKKKSTFITVSAIGAQYAALLRRQQLLIHFPVRE